MREFSLESLLLLTAGAALVSSTNSSASIATPTGSTYSDPAVPTGTPIQGNYTGAYRPQVHFSPPKGFMNDPNGLFVDANGTWHLYYQYNPTDLIAGNQHWGHATSPDLYHWSNQPIALFPPSNDSGIFSGSAVIDSNNTSGLFPDQTDGVVAIYTLNTPQKQTQNIALSYDGGYTFENYSGNPVIDIDSAQFRDPKVVWFQDHWVMVIAYSVDFTIGIYTSYDLLHWDWASNITNIGLLGLQYECPNLVTVPVLDNGTATGELAWVLVISINPGAPQGGSVSEYFPGYFDGYTFSPYDGAARISDFAKDNYAEQFFYGTEADEAISIAWASNWQYTNSVPTDKEGWRSAMSLPRKNYLTKVERTGWDLVSLPYGLPAVIKDEISFDGDFANKSVIIDYSNVSSNALYFEANFTLPTILVAANFSSSSSFNFSFSSSGGAESVRGGYFFGGNNAGIGWLDRGRTNGYGEDDPFFTNRFSSAGVGLAKSISGVIDRSILEVFIDDGAYSGTMVFFPEQPLTNLTLGNGGMPEGVDIKIAVWSLSSVWEQGQGV